MCFSDQPTQKKNLFIRIWCKQIQSSRKEKKNITCSAYKRMIYETSLVCATHRVTFPVLFVLQSEHTMATSHASCNAHATVFFFLLHSSSSSSYCLHFLLIYAAHVFSMCPFFSSQRWFILIVYKKRALACVGRRYVLQDPYRYKSWLRILRMQQESYAPTTMGCAYQWCDIRLYNKIKFFYAI